MCKALRARIFDEDYYQRNLDEINYSVIIFCHFEIPAIIDEVVSEPYHVLNFWIEF